MTVRRRAAALAAAGLVDRARADHRLWPPDATTPFPNSFDVDYIRVYTAR
ncbi:hypothetical protein [Kribbella sp. HUAS MG21]|uniref:Methyltransferase n=1 Tax=Kribbella sp. HUAS MG21 TaxID=3160966 RepID=A0AAU7TGN9_9ACTN